MADAWKEVSVETIKNCFAKCGTTEQTNEDEDNIVDEEFNLLFNELTDSECDMIAEEYLNFDVETCSSLLAINSDMINWRVISVETCETKYPRKECGDLNEVASDNDDDKDGDDDANSNDVEVVEIDTGKSLTMLHRLVNLKDLSKEERNSLVAMKNKLEEIKLLNKKQSHINNYFMSE